MLIQFSVKNFKSFKDKAVLALNPSNDTEHPENIVKTKKYEASALVSIYGANASGKSCLFKAMTVAVLMIKNSNYMQVNQPNSLITPFKFDDKSINEPSEFEFVFVANDGNRYVYGFAANRERVTEEYLYLYRTQRPTMIFERTGDTYEFTKQKSILEPLVRFNTSNKLFLATATNWNSESTMIPYKWLSENLITFTDVNQLTDLSLNLYKGANQKDYIRFTENLLQKVDINISKLSIEVSKKIVNYPRGIHMPSIVVDGEPVSPVTSREFEQIKVNTEHQISDGDVTSKYELEMEEESLGTNMIFVLGPFLKDAFDKGLCVVIDEIDKSLHPLIVKYIVNLYRNKEINKSGAQLVFTTHNTSLLSLTIFRRDQIYFTEKNNKTGVSDLYSLDEFPVRKTENIEKGYIVGRYGAIPYIRGEEL